MDETQASPELSIREKAHLIVTYHQPNQDGIEKITRIRQATEDLIVAILENCPNSADKSAAIRKAREAMMTANASIVVPMVQL